MRANEIEIILTAISSKHEPKEMVRCPKRGNEPTNITRCRRCDQCTIVLEKVVKCRYGLNKGHFVESIEL